MSASNLLGPLLSLPEGKFLHPGLRSLAFPGPGWLEGANTQLRPLWSSWLTCGVAPVKSYPGVTGSVRG